VVKVLQDTSNRDKKLDELGEYYDSMEEAMSFIVDGDNQYFHLLIIYTFIIIIVYYGGFNKSIKNYSHILSNVAESQKRVGTLKKDLGKIKKYLTSRSKVIIYYVL